LSPAGGTCTRLPGFCWSCLVLFWFESGESALEIIDDTTILIANDSIEKATPDVVPKTAPAIIEPGMVI